MAKKKQNSEFGIQSDELQEDITTPPAQPIYFETVMWKGVKSVFKCAKCGTFRDDKDAMIEHVLLHYSFDERERMLEVLLKQ